jgi:hypothetical protein
MLSSAALDQIPLQQQDRLADAAHAALVHQALSARPARPNLHVRLRAASILRQLACRLDSSLAARA